MDTRELICTEVWGGNGNIATDLVIPGLKGFLYSQSSEGHKGGDVYYATACSGGLVSRMYLADVTGHGEPVVQVSHWLHDILRDTIDYKEPSRVFDSLNRRVHAFGLEALTTAASLTFNGMDRTLTVCYAGHPPVLTCTPGENAWRPVEIPAAQTDSLQAWNLPLGVTEDAPYVNGRVPLEDGTRIFVYSDGVTETPGPSGELFGLNRLLDVLKAGNGSPVDAAATAVAAAVAEHAGSSNLTHDDVTFALLEVSPRRNAPFVLQVIGNRLRKLMQHRDTAPVKT